MTELKDINVKTEVVPRFAIELEGYSFCMSYANFKTFIHYCKKAAEAYEREEQREGGVKTLFSVKTRKEENK
jgi:predicted permease